MKFSSRTVKENAAKVAGFIIVILGFARGEKNMEGPTFSWPGRRWSDLKHNYLLEDRGMLVNPFNRVCNADLSLIPVQWSEDIWNHYKQSEYLFHLRETVQGSKRAGKPLQLLSSDKYDSWTSPGFRSARNFYSHCMNLDSETEEDDIASKRILTDTILSNPSGRNPLNYDNDPKYDLPDANDTWYIVDNYYVKYFGLSTFHHITKSVNRTENKIILVLAPPKLLIPERILSSLGPGAIRKEHLKMTTLTRSPKRQAYVDYIHTTLQDISSTYERNRFVDSEEKQINRIEELIDFEINLAKITRSDLNEIYSDDITSQPTFDSWQLWYNQQWMYHDVSVEGKWKKSPILYLARGLISEHFPCRLDWTNRIYKLVRSVVSSEENRITDVTLNRGRVHVKNEMYHLKLCALLRTTKLEVVINYINWNNYRNGLIRTKEGFRKFSELAEKMEFDQHIKKPRSLYCTKTNVLKTPVHWVFANQAKSFIAPIKEKIIPIYKNVLTSLLDTRANRILFGNSGLSKKKMRNDFFSMPINIFGDESWLAESQDLDTDIPNVPKRSNFFGWYIEQQKWQVKNALRLMYKSSSNTSWPIRVDRALVFVTKTEKSYELFLTGAILQPPFFGLDQHEMLNYAGIGAEIATVLWNLVVFPVLKNELVTEAVNYMQKNCPDLMLSNVSTVQYNEIYKNVHRNVDPVEIALNAYAQIGRLNDDGRYAPVLQPRQKKAFVTAHVKTQCEKYKIADTKLYGDKNKIRESGVYYPFKDFSTSKYRINALKMSQLFANVFEVDATCLGMI